MSAVTWAGVALLGGAGAVARFVVDGAIAGRLEFHSLPVGTLAVNVSGAFLLGLVAGVALTGDALLLAGTATLGSYTTFSTWMLETQRLAEGGEPGPAAANIVVSLAAGLAAVALGRFLG
jgi:fluoride exporter